MKYFKHYTSDRNTIEAKLIRKHFGAAGYGIYLSLLEVIGENAKATNVSDWGHVDALHDIETLADECACTTDELHAFLTFCNEKKIFEKHEGRLYSQAILERLDEYAEKIKQNTRHKRVGSKSRQTRDKVVSESVESRKNIAIEEEQETEEEKNTEKKISVASLECLTPKLVKEIADFYSVEVKSVQQLSEEMVLYVKRNGKRYKDYKAALQTWVRTALERKKIFKIQKTPQSTLPDIRDPVSPEILAEFRQKALKSIGRQI